MKNKEIILMIFVGIILFSSLVNAVCEPLTDNDYVASSKDYCNATYHFNDSDTNSVWYVNADNLDLNFNGATLVGDGIYHSIGLKILEYHNNITIRNLIIHNFWDNTNFQNVSGLRLINVTSNYSVHNNIFIGGGQNILLDNVTSTYDRGNHNIYINAYYAYPNNMNNITIQNSLMAYGGNATNPTYGLQLNSNLLGRITNATIKNNIIHSNLQGGINELAGDGTQIYNNQIYNNRYEALSCGHDSSDVSGTFGCINLNFYNNTIYGNGAGSYNGLTTISFGNFSSANIHNNNYWNTTNITITPDYNGLSNMTINENVTAEFRIDYTGSTYLRWLNGGNIVVNSYGLNISLFNQSKNFPYNNLRNVSNGVLLASLFDNYTFVLSANQATNIDKDPLGCTIPIDNLNVNSDKNLCSGTYYLNDTGDDGIFQISNGATATCEGTILIGNGVGNAVQFDTSGGTVKNCYFQNYNSGVYSWDGSNIKIINNTINISVDKGINLRATSGSNISGNRLYSSKYAGVQLYVSASNNIIENNYIYNDSTTSTTRGVYLIGYGINNTVKGNNITFFHHGIDIDGAYNNTIIGNNELSYQGTFASGGLGIVLGLNTTTASVNNNRILNSYWNGYAIKGTYHNITNSYVENSYHHCIDMNIYESTPTLFSKGVYFYNNTCNGSVHSIYISNVNDTRFVNNTLLSATSGGIRFDTGSQNNTAQGNYIQAVDCIAHGANQVSYVLGNKVFNNVFNCSGLVLSTDSSYAWLENNTYINDLNEFYLSTGSWTNLKIKENTTKYLKINHSGWDGNLAVLVWFNYSGVKDIILNYSGGYELNIFGLVPPYNNVKNLTNNIILSSGVENYSSTLSNGQLIAIGLFNIDSVSNVYISPATADYKDALTCMGTVPTNETENGSSYKWYKDNVLILGQTSKILPGSLGFGNGGYYIKCEYTFSNGILNAVPINSSERYITPISTDPGAGSSSSISSGESSNTNIYISEYSIAPNNFDVTLKENQFIYQDFTISNMLGQIINIKITSPFIFRKQQYTITSGSYETIFFKINGDKSVGKYSDLIRVDVTLSNSTIYTNFLNVDYEIIEEDSVLEVTVGEIPPSDYFNNTTVSFVQNNSSSKNNNFLFYLLLYGILIVCAGLGIYYVYKNYM